MARAGPDLHARMQNARALLWRLRHQGQGLLEPAIRSLLSVVPKTQRSMQALPWEV